MAWTYVGCSLKAQKTAVSISAIYSHNEASKQLSGLLICQGTYLTASL